MPDRVKCLHVLAGQSLAQGRGVNPLGDEVLDAARRLVGVRPLRRPCAVTVIAAIDCGTNTIKLLIGDLPDVAVRETRMVRLGQGVDRTGRLADEALERAFAALDEYAALIAEHDVTPTGSGSAPPRPPATPPTPRSSPTACTPGSGSGRRC